MKLPAKKIPYKPIALAFSLCALLIWAILGTGTSLAWFTDVSSEVSNIFHVAQFDLKLAHCLPDGTWEEVDSQTELFDNEALYEPGHVQIVYLRVDNTCAVPFELSVAVNVNGCVVATNAFGHTFLLQDYLKFGFTTASSEAEMKNSIPNRSAAVQIADMPLHHYGSETAVVQPGETKYIALIVRMPEEVNNIANYRGDTIPKVELGITVKADQVR